eukprot:1157510-Pelagomonas_calceolata.AAC.17
MGSHAQVAVPAVGHLAVCARAPLGGERWKEVHVRSCWNVWAPSSLFSRDVFEADKQCLGAHEHIPEPASAYTCACTHNTHTGMQPPPLQCPWDPAPNITCCL